MVHNDHKTPYHNYSTAYHNYNCAFVALKSRSKLCAEREGADVRVPVAERAVRRVRVDRPDARDQVLGARVDNPIAI